MSSEGSREIQAAKKRLAAAKAQARSASENTARATAMLTRAAAAAREARAQAERADKEVEEAASFLAESERRWAVIDVDAPEGSPVDDAGSGKKRKASLSTAANDDSSTGAAGVDTHAGDTVAARTNPFAFASTDATDSLLFSPPSTGASGVGTNAGDALVPRIDQFNFASANAMEELRDANAKLESKYRQLLLAVPTDLGILDGIHPMFQILILSLASHYNLNEFLVSALLQYVDEALPCPAILRPGEKPCLQLMIFGRCKNCSVGEKCHMGVPLAKDQLDDEYLAKMCPIIKSAVTKLVAKRRAEARARNKVASAETRERNRAARADMNKKRMADHAPCGHGAREGTLADLAPYGHDVRRCAVGHGARDRLPYGHSTRDDRFQYGHGPPEYHPYCHDRVVIGGRQYNNPFGHGALDHAPYGHGAR